MKEQNIKRILKVLKLSMKVEIKLKKSRTLSNNN